MVNVMHDSLLGVVSPRSGSPKLPDGPAFEDNLGALELARVPRMRPRTKHIKIKYHHFRQYVAEGLIKIEPIDTLDHLADVFTKAVSRDLFFKFLR